jgi:hypothetical protein
MGRTKAGYWKFGESKLRVGGCLDIFMDAAYSIVRREPCHCRDVLVSACDMEVEHRGSNSDFPLLLEIL